MLSAMINRTAAAAAAARPSFCRLTSRGFAKEIKFGTDGRGAMLKGVNVLADAVQVRALPFCIPVGLC